LVSKRAPHEILDNEQRRNAWGEWKASRKVQQGMVQHQATRNVSLWAQRQDIRKGEGISMTQLREKVAAAVKAKRARKAKTRTNEKYLKMSRKQLENFLEQERRIILGASITQFAVDADASDEERAMSVKTQEGKANWKVESIQQETGCEAKDPTETKLKRKLIDEMLKFESGSQVKMGRKERYQMTAKMGKAMQKEADSQRNAKKIESRKWEKTGKTTMAKFQHQQSRRPKGKPGQRQR
jgi:hypothetical protein